MTSKCSNFNLFKCYSLNASCEEGHKVGSSTCKYYAVLFLYNFILVHLHSVSVSAKLYFTGIVKKSVIFHVTKSKIVVITELVERAVVQCDVQSPQVFFNGMCVTVA